jgi:hypothetical protein
MQVVGVVVRISPVQGHGQANVGLPFATSAWSTDDPR